MIKNLVQPLVTSLVSTIRNESLSVNLWLPDRTPITGIGWIDNGDGTFSCDGSNTGNSNLYQTISPVDIGDNLITKWELLSINANAVRVLYTGATPNGENQTVVAQYTENKEVTATMNAMGFIASAGFIGTVRMISVRKIL